MRAVDINAEVVQRNFAAASADGVRIGGIVSSLLPPISSHSYSILQSMVASLRR